MSVNATVMDAKEATKLLVKGRAPTGLRVQGHLDLSGKRDLKALPENLTADSLDLTGCVSLRELPTGLRVRRLILNNCAALQKLPERLCVHQLEARETPLRELPDNLQVAFRLDLAGCSELQLLPRGLKTGTLILRGCSALEALPEELDVCFLDIAGCVALCDWPRRAQIRIGRLNMAGCVRLRKLPAWLTDLAQLNVSDCENLCELPEGLRVHSWIDVGGSGVQGVPASLQGVPLRWRGVRIDERVAFRPETITVSEIIAESNVERRRVLLERMGYERFFEAAAAKVLDRDRDPGGERRLLRVELPGDEPLVCLAVTCPSTERQYVLRVPPKTRSCRHAAAWIAGYDNPNDYQPVQET